MKDKRTNKICAPSGSNLAVRVSSRPHRRSRGRTTSVALIRSMTYHGGSPLLRLHVDGGVEGSSIRANAISPGPISPEDRARFRRPTARGRCLAHDGDAPQSVRSLHAAHPKRPRAGIVFDGRLPRGGGSRSPAAWVIPRFPKLLWHAYRRVGTNGGNQAKRSTSWPTCCSGSAQISEK